MNRIPNLRPILTVDPFNAPSWVQPYLDCVDSIQARGLGNRWCRIEMFRDGASVGEVTIQVPEGAEFEIKKQRRRLI